MPDHASTSSSSFTLTTSTPEQETGMRLIFDDPHDGTELVRIVRGSDRDSTVEITFDPQDSNETLRGQPSHWANTPGAGRPLVFTVPAPAPGSADITGTLIVTRGSSGLKTKIPIRVTRNE